MFDRTADETISWILEKDAALSAEDYGHDLETIQALVRKHEGFEADLAAVKEQVRSLLSLSLFNFFEQESSVLLSINYTEFK